MIAVLACACALAGLPAQADAAVPAPAVQVRTFAVPTADAGLSNLVEGPDGALWFNEQNAFEVGRITSAGAISQFAIPREPYSAAGDGPSTIVASGANLWTLSNVGSTIEAISVAGTVTPMYARLNQSATNIAADSRGGVWAASLSGAGGGSVSGGLFRVDPPTGAVRNYRAPRFGGQYQPLPMTPGPDGTVWFADGGSAIKRVTSAGRVTAIRIHGSGSMLVTSLASDRKGDLWFTEYVPGGGYARSTGGAIGEIRAGSTVATVTKLPGNKAPGSLLLGPDGGVWFTWARGVGRIAPRSGVIQLVRLAHHHLSSIAFGAGRRLWFVDARANVIGRVPVAQLQVGTHTPLPKPVIRLANPSLTTAAATGQLKLRCRLSAAARCAVTVALSAGTAHALGLERKRSPAALPIGGASRQLKRAGTAPLTITLPPAVTAALRARRRSRVPLTVTATTTIVTGRFTRATRTLTLR